MYSVNDKYEALIMSYLDGQCSAEEAHELLLWVAESEENRLYFNALKDEHEVWGLTDFAMPELDEADVEAALDAVNAKIDAVEETEIRIVQMPWLHRNYRSVASVAAAAVVILFLGFFLSKPNTVTVAYNEAQPEMVYQMPDGSSFCFDGNGTVNYPKQFADDNRQVKFEGKARFDVAKDASRPFVIHCDGFDVEVLGTSFMLDADKQIVDLYTGAVRMTSVDKRGHEIAHIDLLPSDRGVYTADGELKLMTYPEVKEEEMVTNHVLVFDNESLSKIVEALEYLYKVKINLDESCASKKLTARFSDEESIDEVMETIAIVSEVTVTKKDNVYTIH